MEVTRFLPLLGRLLIGLPLLMSGLGKLTTYAATTAYISSVGLPLAPLGWAIAVAFEIGGGLLLLLGFRARKVAFGLGRVRFGNGSLLSQEFCRSESDDPFLKNIMIIGGLLQIVHFGAGRFSLDARDPKNVAGATT